MVETKKDSDPDNGESLDEFHRRLQETGAANLTAEPGTPIIRDPVSAPAGPSGPITYEVGKPGANGWRTLTLTGTPGASYVVSNNGDVLYTGVLDSGGTAELAVRGSVANLAVGYGLSALTAASGEPGGQ